jgi:DNA-binding NarL/FixJ family response regulator
VKPLPVAYEDFAFLKPHSIVIVDDHPILAEALVRIMCREFQTESVTSCASANELLRCLARSRTDLVLMDLNLGPEDGLEVIRTVRSIHPRQKILVFSLHDEADYAARACSAGAAGFVMKDHTPDRLIEAARVVLEGKTFFADGAAQAGENGRTRHLTAREEAVFALLGQGLSTGEMAAQLGLSPKTVEKHRENIKRKLSISNTTKLIAEAARWVMTRPTTPPRP